MNTQKLFQEIVTSTPLVAILRGVKPERAVVVGEILYAAGFRMIEVPLNSPDAIVSIELLAEQFGGNALIGAGTVTKEEDVKKSFIAGGKLIVSPNVDARVITASRKMGMISLPGYRTPSEAFKALSMGADGLKLFPCEDVSPRTLNAMKTVLPTKTRVFCVGGVGSEEMGPWLHAGASGFAFGSSLFKPHYTLQDIKDRATMLVSSFREKINSVKS